MRHDAEKEGPPRLQAFRSSNQSASAPPTSLASVVFRAAAADDGALFWDFLGVITGRSRAWLSDQPDMAKYACDWGREGDVGVIAERDGAAIGAGWLRQFTLNERPFVWIDATTPELALAVTAEWRGLGVGDTLLKELIAAAQGRASGICLNVRATNPAIGLYQRWGFVEIPGARKANRFGGESIGMVLRFASAPSRPQL